MLSLYVHIYRKLINHKYSTINLYYSSVTLYFSGEESMKYMLQAGIFKKKNNYIILLPPFPSAVKWAISSQIDFSHLAFNSRCRFFCRFLCNFHMPQFPA